MPGIITVVGNQADQAKAEEKSLRVKSSLRGSNTRVSGVADFESWKYGDTFLEKSYRRPRCSDWTLKIFFGKGIRRSTTFQLTPSSNSHSKGLKKARQVVRGEVVDPTANTCGDSMG